MEKKISPAKVVVLGEGMTLPARNLSIIFFFISSRRQDLPYPALREWPIQRETALHRWCHLSRKVLTFSLSNGFARSLNIGSQSIKLVIWDTAGQERYHALNQVYYRGAEGAVVVYDCTDADTFKKMNQWVSELRQYLPQEVPIMIAGNKADLGASSSTKKIDDE